MRTICLLLLLLLSVSVLVHGQTPAPPPPPAPLAASPLTLAKALAAAVPPSDGLALAVDAAGVTLPKDAEPLPDTGATVRQVGAAFGELLQDFGDVTAVAPATIVALNPDPHDPNIYDGMAPADVLVLLAGSLDDAQWKALTGANGIGLSDLTTEDQQHLFMALFPGGKLTIHQPPQMNEQTLDQLFSILASNGQKEAEQAFEALNKANARDVSDELPQTRLRLGQKVQISLPTGLPAGGVGNNYMPLDADLMPDTPSHWEVLDDNKPKDTLYGVPVRATVPNVPKDGQLNFDLSVLQRPVPAAPWKTVGELVSAVGRTVRMEIYVDRRWEGKSLTVIGAQSAIPARDLLRAVALCLGGTYRKVGAAYVLTYDLAGVGAIRQRWSEFYQDADALKSVPAGEAADHLYAAHSPHDLTPSSDLLALSPDEQKRRDTNGYSEDVTLPFAQLTPAQQDFASRATAQMEHLKDRIAQFVAQHPKQAQQMGDPGNMPSPSLSGNAELTTTPEMELLLPSLGQPVRYNNFLRVWNLFRPSEKRAEAEANAKAGAQKASPTPKALPPAPPLSAVLPTIPRRAVLAHPRTVAEVDALLKAMRRAGMNTLYLDVFSEGQSHLNGSPDILDESLARAKGAGIAVFPVVDLFVWGEKTPDALQDVNILGETYALGLRRQEARNNVRNVAAGLTPAPLPTGPLYTSPAVPDVQATLTGILQDIATRPGISGIAWRDATVPGYKPTDGMDTTALGYSQSARLSFLRRRHVDPSDISFPTYIGNVDLSLPGFDESGADDGLQTQWRTARTDAHDGLLKTLFNTTRPLNVFVERAGGAEFGYNDDWYGTWDGFPKPLPAFHYPWENAPAGAINYQTTPADVQAKSQSRFALRVIAPGDLLGPRAADWLQKNVQKPKWDGFVLDAAAPRFGQGKAPPDLAATLDKIAQEITGRE